MFLRPAASPGDLLEMQTLHLLIPNLHFNKCAEDGIARSSLRTTVEGVISSNSLSRKRASPLL